MTNRLHDTEIWKKDWFLELTDKQKLLTKFLFDNCDCAGFYKISWHLLNCFFSEAPTREDFEKIKQVKFIDKDLIFIEDFALFQCKVKSFNELNPKNNAHKGVLKLLKKYNIFEGASEGLVSPLEDAQDKDKEKEKENTFNNSLKEEKEKIKKEKEEIFASLTEWHGEYSNVHLTKSQYDKLLNEILDKPKLDELIGELSENIACNTGKAPPYDENKPDMHYAILRKYWRWRKQNGSKKTVSHIDKAQAFKNELDAITEKYRLKEAGSG